MATRVRPSDDIHQRLAKQSETIDRLQKLCDQQRQVINQCCDIALDAVPGQHKKIADPEYQCLLIIELCRSVQDMADIRIT